MRPRALGCDAVALVDVGGDVLGHGDEPGLASPLCDAILLAASRFLELPCVGVVFGPGCDGELTVPEVLERDRRGRGGRRAARRVGPHAERDGAARGRGRRGADRGERAGRCAARAASTAPATIRGGRRSVELSPVGAVAFYFDPEAAIRSAARLADAVTHAASLEEAEEILAARGVTQRAGVRAARVRRLAMSLDLHGSPRLTEILRRCYSHVEVADRERNRALGVTNLKRIFGRPDELRVLSTRSRRRSATSARSPPPTPAARRWRRSWRTGSSFRPCSSARCRRSTVAGERIPPGSPVHIIDDLVHSGETLASAARTLREAELVVSSASSLLIAPPTTGWPDRVAAAGIGQITRWRRRRSSDRRARCRLNGSVRSMRRTGILAVALSLLLAAPAAAQLPIPTAVPTAVPTVPPVTGSRPSRSPTRPTTPAASATSSRPARAASPTPPSSPPSSPPAAGRRTAATSSRSTATWSTRRRARPARWTLLQGRRLRRAEGEVERRYSPRDDVTIVRDAGFGVPHVYGRDRDGAMFGLGYATAEDRLFFMDIFRHARARAALVVRGRRTCEPSVRRAVWSVAPYTEDDLSGRRKPPPGLPGRPPTSSRAEPTDYLAGVNQYIAEARSTRRRCRASTPRSTTRTDRTLEPRRPRCDGRRRSSARSSALAAARNSTRAALQAARQRFGRARANACGATSARRRTPRPRRSSYGKRFPYQARQQLARDAARSTAAARSPARVEFAETIEQAAGAGRKGLLEAALVPERPASNAMLVSARESASGNRSWSSARRPPTSHPRS